jgi:hypothetical protein
LGLSIWWRGAVAGVWIDEGALVTKYCNTLSMAADIGTKALGEKQFVFCRDLMNGYALAMRNGRRRQQADQCDVHLLGRTAEQVKLQRRRTTAVTPTTRGCPYVSGGDAPTCALCSR